MLLRAILHARHAPETLYPSSNPNRPQNVNVEQENFLLYQLYEVKSLNARG